MVAILGQATAGVAQATGSRRESPSITRGFGVAPTPGESAHPFLHDQHADVRHQAPGVHDRLPRGRQRLYG